MKILITAFEPFGDEQINASWEVLKCLHFEDDNTIQIKKLLIPTVFHKSIELLKAAIELEQPDAVLCLGQAAGRCDITPERVAINIDDARIKDNEGNQPMDIPVFEDGAPAYFSTLPIKAMIQNMKEAGIPASLSNSAGTFVCNHLMYGLLYTLDKHYPHIRGGFIHIPLLPEQAVTRNTPSPSMSKEMIIKGIKITAQTIFN